MIFARLFHRHSVEDTNLRNFIFGIEDSLVSTVGLLAGVAVADVSRSSIITTGIVLIVVEGLSMGIGSFLTEETTGEMVGSRPEPMKAITGGTVMLFSYCLAGLLPLSPYAFFPGPIAVTISIVASLTGLFLLGFGTALYYHRSNPAIRGFKMLFMGGLAVAIGMLVGKLFHV
ncbi:MAG: VIT1/CCC1 transporter family protein [bacterium]